MGRRDPLYWTQRQLGNLFRRVSFFFYASSQLNDLSRNKALTGTFLYGSTTARTSNQLLGWNCGYACCSNVRPLFLFCRDETNDRGQMMFGVLYAMSPEIFPAKDRGTGNGLTATAQRVFSVMVCVFSVCSTSHLEHAHRAHHCVVRQLGDGGASVYFGRDDHVCGNTGLVVAV